MHWPTWSPKIEFRLRAILLAIAVLASVVLPYSIIRTSADATLEASAWVVHSADVKQKMYELRFNLSELESLALAAFVDIPQVAGRATYESIRDSIGPMLDSLAEETRDNPDQQGRIGSLRMLYQGRIGLLDTAMQQIREKNFDAAAASLKQAALMFGSREIPREIIAGENALYVQRTEHMQDAKSVARWIVSAALLAQLVLLGSIIVVSERQTQRRHAAEKLARNAVERSSRIVQTLREPIAVLDSSLSVLTANEAFIEVYGAPAGKSADASLDRFGGGAWDHPGLLQRLRDVAARGREIWDFELLQRNSEAIERIVLVNARRMELADDADLADGRTILLTVTDVTARKRYEERISELNAELGAKVAQVSEVNRELESFSYSVSHDLRAPLRHIAGFADKLGVHIAATADDRAHHYLQVIGDAARRMSTLIEDLLEYSRLGRSAFRTGPVDMNALVADQRAMFESNNEGRRIAWRIGRLPMVIGDESMLRRVWQNLISNAVKYSARKELAEIDIGADSSNPDEIIYHVRDNGTGFDMAYAGKLFGVFQRLHKVSEFPGTGIGLANVRRIISRLGGRTWAEAEPDKGATVYFSLPALSGAIPLQEVPDES